MVNSGSYTTYKRAAEEYILVTDLIVHSGIILTMDPERRVYEDGAIAVAGREIIDVGPTEDVCTTYNADREIDADSGLIIPGLINTHVHVPDILYRSVGKGRGLHDWLFNVKRPIVHSMGSDEHALSAALYCREALCSGVTTFVENAGGTGSGYAKDIIDAKLDVYDEMGVRNVYAHGFLDAEPDEEISRYIRTQERKETSTNHVTEPVVETEEAMDTIESLIEEYHMTADGRQTVWPAPFLAWGVTPEGLAGAYEIAEKYDVMTTTHTAESPAQERHLATSVEYLESAGYLGNRTLLGHCVQVSDADIRRLAESGTKVAHNVVTNCSLGTGVAPVPAMREHGVTVGLGTDNIAQNDTVNPLSDLKFAVMVHQVHKRDPGVITAEEAVEMATIDAARAIGRSDTLGSIESGKTADFAIIGLDHPHLTPYSDLASLLAYQIQGTEITAVVCNGELVVENGTVTNGRGYLPDSAAAVTETQEELLDRAGIDLPDRPRYTRVN